MTDKPDNRNLDDPVLVAYLDGELAPEARARIAHRLASDHDLQQRLILLSRGGRPFREAFEPLLDQAPRARLEAMLAGLPGRNLPSAPAIRPVRRWSGLKALAASVALFLAGLGVGWFIPMLSPSVREQAALENAAIERGSPDDEWRQAVSEYLSLYTTETLASIPDNAAVREQELSSIGAKTGLVLSPQKIALPELSFKRAQLLQYDGRRLGQIAYLDPESGPVALCFIASSGPDSKPQVEQRQGSNVVYWSRGGYSFMLIGPTPSSRLQRFASELFLRLT
jgi:anti-sigma factor RsiW